MEVYLATSFKYKNVADLAHVKGESMAVNVLGAAADLLIAATLCTILNFSRTGFQKSNAMINKLIIFTVNTGLITSLCALASLISILAAPKTWIYVTFYYCLGRLYTNSLLATLNARSVIRGIGEKSENSMPFSLEEFFKSESGQRRSRNISVQIDPTQQEHRPDDDQKPHYGEGSGKELHNVAVYPSQEDDRRGTR